MSIAAIDVLRAVGPDGYQTLTGVMARLQASFWRAGKVYPLMHSLETAGLLKSKWVPGEEPRRRVYALTVQGAQCLKCDDMLKAVKP